MRRRTILLKNELPAEAFPNRILFLDWKTTKYSPPKASPMQAQCKQSYDVTTSYHGSKLQLHKEPAYFKHHQRWQSDLALPKNSFSP